MMGVLKVPISMEFRWHNHDKPYVQPQSTHNFVRDAIKDEWMYHRPTNSHV